jgi:hypothetical protein
MLRLAELAARECDGKDAFSVPVLIAAIRQRRLEVKMREIGSSVGTCRRLRLDVGKPEVDLNKADFPLLIVHLDQITSVLPTTHPESTSKGP